MKTKDNKIVASSGKILFCKKLNRYATSTTDKKHKWIDVPVEEMKNGN